METHPDKPRFQKIFFALGGSVIGVFSAAVLLGILVFRMEVREQVVERDGRLLARVAQYLAEEYPDPPLDELALMELALDSSEIAGIVAVRVFDSAGRQAWSVPNTVFPVALSPGDRAVLEAGHPVTRYFPEYPMEALFSDLRGVQSPGDTPMVEVIAPLGNPGDPSTAAIQYWLDGTTLAAEFNRLDRYLVLMGTLFIGGGMVIFSILFLYARGRLIGMARLLAERNQRLRQANAELDMAARTSAIGTVASHLFHGLKNPLAGLKTYLRITGQDEEAVALADRMQALINESLSVIRQEGESAQFTLDHEEFRKVLDQRLAQRINGHPQRLSIECRGRVRLSGRQAELVLLILGNLVENALEASPGDQPVKVSIETDGTELRLQVADSGPGLPDSIRRKLFEPVSSTKTGGTGIGLAISAVLARHVPAKLELLSSGPQGTVFQLTLNPTLS